MLSIIIPAFNEEANIDKAVSEISAIMTRENIPFEMLFIDDGSTDKTWDRINVIHQSDKRIHGIKFSRNFGKEGAIFAGLRAAKGECAVVIDCDLQHPPETIPKMYRLWESGYEVVEAKKASRGKENVFHKLFAKLFYQMMKSSSDINVERASDFKLLDRKVIDALLQLPERVTFFRALSSWVGFSSVEVEFEVQPRFAGKTKWNFPKLLSFALSNLTSFTNLPMQLITLVGVIFLVFAVILGIHTLLRFFSGTAAAGFSTVILLILIVGAVLMIGLGIIGYYISKIYEEIKFRPRYIIKEQTQGDSDDH